MAVSKARYCITAIQYDDYRKTLTGEQQGKFERMFMLEDFEAYQQRVLEEHEPAVSDDAIKYILIGVVVTGLLVAAALLYKS